MHVISPSKIRKFSFMILTNLQPSSFQCFFLKQTAVKNVKNVIIALHDIIK